MLTCATCGHESRQLFNPKKKPPETEAGEEKKTLVAAKVNGEGPVCELCRHLEMALRYAKARGLGQAAEFISRAQIEVEGGRS